MEKRLFLAFVIILAFFVIYSNLVSRLVPQPVPSQEDSREYADSRRNIERPDVLGLPKQTRQKAPLLVIEDQEELIDLPQIVVENFIITYSPLGGYIKKIAIDSEDNQLPFQNIGFFPGDEEKLFTVRVKDAGLEFRSPGGEKKEFIFKDSILEIRLDPPPPGQIVLFSNSLHSSVLDQRYQEIFYSQNQIIKRTGPKKLKESTYNNMEFAGARDRYHCFSLLKDNYDFNWVKGKDIGHFYLISPPEQILVYIGPQVEKELKPYELEGIISYGFFHGIGAVMIKILHLFYALTKNWGLSIVLFSAAVSLLLFPFTSKSTQAMQKMQKVQPEVEALKAKYKDNPQKLQKETVELYRQYKINPLGGCLPLLFQIPIIMAFYQIVFRFVELKGAGFLWIKDLSLPDRLCGLPFPAPLNYLNIIPLLLVGIGLLQQKITASSAGSSQQKSMALFFTVFIGVIFYSFPSALTLYWFVQNLVTLAYQARLARK